MNVQQEHHPQHEDRANVCHDVARFLVSVVDGNRLVRFGNVPEGKGPQVE